MSSIKLSYRISGIPGPMFQPTGLQFASPSKDSECSPFACMSDALTGLSASRLVQFQNPEFPTIAGQTQPYWSALDVSHQLYQRMKPAKNHKTEAVDSNQWESLEKTFDSILSLAVTAHNDQPVIDIRQLANFVDCIDQFEAHFDRPMIFHSSYQLPEPVREKFMVLYSFLYHLRSLVVLDYNSHLADRTSDSIKMDRISNYLPNPEFIVNDAIFWSKIKDTVKSWKAEDFEGYYSQIVHTSQKLAKRWIHNGFFLQASTPQEWYSSLDDDELQDELYNFQMHWLLGSDAGLLFKVREEAYALSEGYDKIFYPDISSWNAQKMDGLQMDCEVTDAMVESSAA